MTKGIKKIIIFVLSTLLVLAVSLIPVFYNKVQTVDATFLLTTENVAVETEKSVSQEFLSGRTGYAFSSTKNGEKISLKEGCAGIFSIDFTPYSDTVGEAEFEKFTFTFSSVSSRVAINLAFVPTDTGLLMNVILSNSLGRNVSVNMDGSFCNISDKSVKFSFDPQAMVIKNAKGDCVADFKSADFLAHYYIPEPLLSFETYSVDMAFEGIAEGKTAKVMIFDVCGQRLSGDTLVNTSAPVIYSLPTLDNGVVGVNYDLSKNVKTFDVIDGFKNEFAGDIKVYNDINELITLTNENSFVPDKAGNYIVEYTPIDENGLKGNSETVKFYVYPAQPEIEFVYATPISDNMEVGVGTKLTFPKIYAVSELTSNQIQVTANVILEGVNKLSNADCANGFGYIFDTIGSYTVEFSAKDVSGYVAKETVAIAVSEIAVFTDVDFGSVYAKDVTVNLGNSKCILNGESFGQVEVLTTYPSGRTTSAYNVICDEEGIYSVLYSSSVNDVTVSTVRYFTVKNDNLSLWEATSGLIIETDSVAPDYADFAYNGVTLIANRPVEAVYKNAVNVADNTKDDLLCELFVAPVTAGTQELTCIDIILTDVYDSEKVLDIRLTQDIWKRIESRRSMSVIALPIRDFTNTTLYELNPNSTANEVALKYYYNSSIFASFYGKFGDSATSYPSNSIKFYLDYEEGKIYADYSSVKGQANGKLCIVDLNNESYVGTGNAWKGFTTGEVKLSVKLSEIKQTAHVMVLNIDGQAMSGKSTVDTTAPSIVIDYAGNSQNNLPKAVVGKTYKIFNPISVDLIDGYSKNVQISVYKKQGAAIVEYPRNDMEFIPDEVGTYVIRYQAADSSGNTAVKEVKITAVDSVEPLLYKFNEDLLTEYYVGQTFNYLSGVITGGTGAVSKDLKVFLEDEEIQLDGDNSFLIEKEGTYTLQIILLDYVGVSEPFELKFSAEYSPKPIMKAVSMPEALVQDETVTLPDVDAKLYTASDVQNVSVTWYVRYGENGEFTQIQKDFTPTESGVIYLKAEAGGSEQIYKVNVTEKRSSSDYNFISQYIYTDSSLVPFERKDLFDPTATSAIHYEFNNDSVWSVARKIDVNFASIKFGISKCYFDRVSIIFRDALNPEICVTCTITNKNDNESYVNVNGINYVVNASFVNASAFGEYKVVFNPKDNSIVINSVKVAEVEKTDNGKTFNGFTGGSVYLTLEIKGSSDNTSKIGISEIAGQSIIPTLKVDNIGPTIAVDGVIEDVEFGEYINILNAIAYDFISNVKSISVSITSPSGKELYKEVAISDVQPILTDEIGIYRIEYVAYDSSNNKSTYPVNIKIIDYVAPVIELSGIVPTEGKVGNKVVIPTMTVTDDHTAAEDIVTYVYYVAPDGKTVEINGNGFTPNQKGMYVIVYFAQDGDGSTSVQYYQVRVK